MRDGLLLCAAQEWLYKYILFTDITVLNIVVQSRVGGWMGAQMERFCRLKLWEIPGKENCFFVMCCKKVRFIKIFVSIKYLMDLHCSLCYLKIIILGKMFIILGNNATFIDFVNSIIKANRNAKWLKAGIYLGKLSKLIVEKLWTSPKMEG